MRSDSSDGPGYILGTTAKTPFEKRVQITQRFIGRLEKGGYSYSQYYVMKEDGWLIQVIHNGKPIDDAYWSMADSDEGVIQLHAGELRGNVEIVLTKKPPAPPPEEPRVDPFARIPVLPQGHTGNAGYIGASGHQGPQGTGAAADTDDDLWAAYYNSVGHPPPSSTNPVDSLPDDAYGTATVAADADADATDANDDPYDIFRGG